MSVFLSFSLFCFFAAIRFFLNFYFKLFMHFTVSSLKRKKKGDIFNKQKVFHYVNDIFNGSRSLYFCLILTPVKLKRRNQLERRRSRLLSRLTPSGRSSPPLPWSLCTQEIIHGGKKTKTNGLGQNNSGWGPGRGRRGTGSAKLPLKQKCLKNNEAEASSVVERDLGATVAGRSTDSRPEPALAKPARPLGAGVGSERLSLRPREPPLEAWEVE